MLKRLLFAGGLTASLSFAAFAADAPATPAATPAGTGAALPGRTAAALPDDEMLARIHAVNKREIDLGQIASEHSQTPIIKRYGAMLVEEHTQADKKVTQVAQAQKIALREPQAQNAADRQQMAQDKADADHLKTLSGDAFDRAFASAMLQGHADMIALVDQARVATKNAALKSFYGNVLSTLRKHMDRAADIVAMQEVGDLDTGAAGSGSGSDDAAPKKDKPSGGEMGTPMDSDDASKIDH